MTQALNIDLISPYLVRCEWPTKHTGPTTSPDEHLALDAANLYQHKKCYVNLNAIIDIIERETH